MTFPTNNRMSSNLLMLFIREMEGIIRFLLCRIWYEMVFILPHLYKISQNNDHVFSSIYCLWNNNLTQRISGIFFSYDTNIVDSTWTK